MSLEDDLYQEIILENYRSKKNRRKIEGASLHAEGANPSCGDDLELFLSIEDDVVTDASYEGVGCSICCASANLLCESLHDRSTQEAREILKQFKGMLLDDLEPDFADEISDLEAMQGVKNYPVRIKCALLPWNTLGGLLDGVQ